MELTGTRLPVPTLYVQTSIMAFTGLVVGGMGLLPLLRGEDGYTNWGLVIAGGSAVFAGVALLIENDPDSYKVETGVFAIVLFGGLMALIGLALTLFSWM